MVKMRSVKDFQISTYITRVRKIIITDSLYLFIYTLWDLFLFLPPFSSLSVTCWCPWVLGATPGSPGSRLRPPESSKRPGSADCGLDRVVPRRIPSRDCLNESVAPLHFLRPLAGGRGGGVVVSNTSVQCGGMERAPEEVR